MTPVDRSSTIEAIEYAPATQLLKVKFKSGGTYHFEAVPPAEHQKLMTAQSIGKHFHRHIKGAFKSVKQEEKR